MGSQPLRTFLGGRTPHTEKRVAQALGNPFVSWFVCLRRHTSDVPAQVTLWGPGRGEAQTVPTAPGCQGKGT